MLPAGRAAGGGAAAGGSAPAGALASRFARRQALRR